MTGRIVGTGSYVPNHFLTNDDLANMVETTDAWIQERTGVKRRHIAKEDSTVSMAVKAAKEAVEDAGILPDELDLIVVSTTASESLMPCIACEVQKELGAENAFCFDLNAACSGFLVAYSTALGYIEMGMVKKAVIVGTEKMSKQLDWTDRSTCILFGDGAGAVVIEAAPGVKNSIVLHSDGSRGGALQLKAQGAIKMNGQEVFRFAVKNVPKAISELLEQIGKEKTDIDYYLLHQANKRIIDAVAKRLELARDRFPDNIAEYANTSSASIPILIDEMKKSGRLKQGQSLLMAGFGAGLTWGAAYIII